MDWDLQCQNCGGHFALGGGDNLTGALVDGLACPDCGGLKFYRNQPSPVQSEMDGGIGTARDMVDSDSQKDQGGNPLGEGTIMGTDGERPFGKRDNYMHGHVAGFGDPFDPGETDAPEPGTNWSYHTCPACGSREGTAPSTDPRNPHWYCPNCNQAFAAPNIHRLQEDYKRLLGNGQHDLAREKFDEIQHVQNMEALRDPQAQMTPDRFMPADPWMDNEPGTLTYPSHWGRKSVAVERSLNMEPYEMDGLFDLPTDYRRMAAYKQALGVGDIWNAVKGVGGDIAQVAPAVGEAGLAAAAPLDQEIPGLDVASDAAVADEVGSLAGGAAEQAGQSLMQKGIGKGVDMAKNTLMNQAKNQIKQRLLPAGGVAGLMKGALGMGAAGAGGAAIGGGPGIQTVPGAPGVAPTEEGVGIQTPPQGQWWGSIADIPMILTADLETSDSIKSVGEQNGDDPEKVDQKEFNDQDKKPSNLKNPNNEDSGSSGEDGVRERTEGYGFGPNSPAIDRAMLLLPLILHYYQSEESGENDPLLKGLHDMLEQENPGYLNEQHPEGHKVVQEIIQLHKPHPGEHQAGVNMMAPGGMVPQQWANPAPQAMQNTQQMASSRCQNCGAVTEPGQPCPQCGNAHMANTIGPVTKEQQSVVEQYLVDHGRAEEAPNVALHPEQYAQELAEITRQPNVPPMPDPSQITPLVPQPTNPGAMPMPDPGAANGPASGAPLQPMSSYTDPDEVYLRSLADEPKVSAVDALVWPIEEIHTAANAAPRCPKCQSGSTTPRPGQEGVSFECHSCFNLWDDKDVDTIKYKGSRVAKAAPRCPYCGSGSTTPRPGQEGISFECHSCRKIWDDKDVDTLKYKGSSFKIEGLVDVPNPNMQLQNDQGMAWKDTADRDLQEGQTYEIHSAAFPVPTVATIVKVHPNHLDMKVAEGPAAMLNPDENQPDFQIKRKEAQLDDYQFTPLNYGADADTRQPPEPPAGGTTPGLSTIPDQAPTTDEMTNSFPNTSVSSVTAADEDGEEEEVDHCVKCGSTMLDHTMRNEDTTLHSCVPCGHAWETHEDYQGREASVDLSWLLSGGGPGDDDFWSGMERAQEMREAGTQSRNLADIVRKDSRYQEIHERLTQNAMQREAGKHYTPSEKRALINERGRARNLEDLDLTNTHYDIREDYSGKANGMNVREDDLFLGI